MLRLFSSKGVLYTALILFCHVQYNNCEFCEKSDTNYLENEQCGFQSSFSPNRYILYDVNPSEGFNLRRDVYIRVATFMKHLAESDDTYKWKLVLPPWSSLYHWRSKGIGPQAQLPWSLFFDIASLNKFAPVIEMYEFLKEYPSVSGRTEVDIVYILQNDDEMFKSGKFRDRNEVKECNEVSRYHQINVNKYTGYFWGYGNLTARNVKCITFHGTVSSLEQNLRPSLYKSIMFDHMEIPLHDYYGSREYWMARRSMRYNNELYTIASNYRKKFLNSTDEKDHTKRPADWRKENGQRNAIGGPYMCVHLRRQDFTVSRASSLLSIEATAKQLKDKLRDLRLHDLFVATDTTDEEFLELQSQLSGYAVHRFTPSNYILNTFKDGGVAIIDQIICSHARYFIGTDESTFSFRIQEDREIMGFPSDTTFNRLCKKKKCGSTGRWEIVW